MINDPAQRQAGSSPLPAPLSVNFILVYEDTATGLRAKQSIDALSRRLAGNAELRTRLCRLDLLRTAWFREQIALEAAAAHVIILSVHGDQESPTEVREWLESWLKHKEARAYALGVLLDPSVAVQASPNSVVVYVRQIAESAGADFFCSLSEAFGTGAETVDAGGKGRVSCFAPVSGGLHARFDTHPRRDTGE